MQSVKSNFLRLAVVIAGLCVSDSALAATFTTPFGSSAVDIYVGYRTNTWLEGHIVLWKRRSDGKCQSFVLPTGNNTVIGSSKDDLIKVLWAPETVSCSGGAATSLVPVIGDIGLLTVKGGSGADTMLVTDPVWYAFGEAGNDLIVVVDNSTIFVYGGRDNDVLESWGSGFSELYGDDGQDCLWQSSLWLMSGGGG